MKKKVIVQLREIQSNIEGLKQKVSELDEQRQRGIDSLKNLQGQYDAYYNMATELGLVEGDAITEAGAAIIQELEANSEVEHVGAEEVTE